MRRALTFRTPILAAALLAAGPSGADWLRTRDGAMLETKGPWSVRGSQVIFTAPNGTLSSLRVAEVDLDASAVATLEARNPQPPVVVEPPEAVVAITMKDVRRAAPPAAEEPAETAADAETPKPPVSVVAWRAAEGPDGGLQILGTLRNEGRDIVTDLGVTVALLDGAGRPVSTANAFLGAVSLAPGITTTLRALFPDVHQFAGEPTFEVRANSIRIQTVSAAAEDEGSTQEAGGES